MVSKASQRTQRRASSGRKPRRGSTRVPTSALTGSRGGLRPRTKVFLSIGAIIGVFVFVSAALVLAAGMKLVGDQSYGPGAGGPAAALGAEVPPADGAQGLVDAGLEVDEAGPGVLPPMQSTEIATLPDPEWVAQVSAATGIPERALAAYAGADLIASNSYGCRVGWNTLAGIGYVESHHGTLFGGAVLADGSMSQKIFGIPLNGENNTMAIEDTDKGRLDGDVEWDRAVGPLQFIPETWEIWGVDGNGDGAEDPHHIDDAAMSAALYLCNTQGTLEGAENWISAIRSYNNTDDYQQQVADAASHYAKTERGLFE